MTTPTDDEIVKYVLAQDSGYAGTAVRQALRIAREGLPVPVKDEARDLWDTAYTAWHRGSHDAATEAVRTFLADRDAERDAAVAELVAAVKEVIDDTPAVWANMRLVPALAKLERKP
jgi:hypothetical protein